MYCIFVGTRVVDPGWIRMELWLPSNRSREAQNTVVNVLFMY